jgi:CBS domain-containing protein
MALEKLKVRDVMSTEVVTIGRNDKLAIADDVMKQERIRHMPVLNADDDVCGIIIFLKSPYRRFPVMSNDRLVGQISRRDVLKALEELW